MLKAGIVGAAGYAGGELLRLLAAHPDVRPTGAVSNTYSGRPIGDALPGMEGVLDLTFQRHDEFDPSAYDIVFLAQESGKAMRSAKGMLQAGARVVDLSADFRISDPGVYAAWYGEEHTSPELLPEAHYGLPELYKYAIGTARLIANPGCYPTASLLALAPLAAERLIDPKSIIIDAKSGVSGAGRGKASLAFHYPEVNESVSAYKTCGTHRHTPEIEQVLSWAFEEPAALTFTPHLVPITRGILATSYASASGACSTEQLDALYRDFYAGAPFVRIVDAPPATKHTAGTNTCRICPAYDARTGRITVVSAIDNLIKGAAGQAIQNMNIMCGLPETAGLQMGAMWP